MNESSVHQPAACTCDEMRARHRPPAPDDPDQTRSQVRCSACCMQSFDQAIAALSTQETP